MAKINSSMEIKLAVRTMCVMDLDALMVIDALDKLVREQFNDQLMPWILELDRHEIHGHLIVRLWQRCGQRMEHLVDFLSLSRLKKISDEEVRAIVHGHEPIDWPKFTMRFMKAAQAIMWPDSGTVH